MRAPAIIAAALAAATPATAAPPAAEWNVAAPVHGLLGGGLVIEAEHQLWPRWSLAGFAGVRATTSGDYRSLALSGGAEARWWLLGWTVSSPLRESIVGGYLGAGLELSTVWLRDEIEGRGVGSTTSVAVVANVGYRFAPWSRISITPSAGLAIGRDIAGGLPDRFTVRPRYGITVGVLF